MSPSIARHILNVPVAGRFVRAVRQDAVGSGARGSGSRWPKATPTGAAARASWIGVDTFRAHVRKIYEKPRVAQSGPMLKAMRRGLLW